MSKTALDVFGEKVGLTRFMLMGNIQRQEIEEAMNAYADQRVSEALNGQWVSVKERPLFGQDDHGWFCTPDGEKPFIAAVPLSDGSWWIRHCVVEDRIGLCVVGDDENEKAGWELEDVTHYQPLPSPPLNHRER